MTEIIYDLEERTALFSEGVIALVKKYRKDNLLFPVLSQLLRAGTSVGANYREANGASSKRDFVNKIHICKKESKETEYWLRVLGDVIKEATDECKMFNKEAHELTLIFSKIASSSKQKIIEH
ncbi:four helix bundle protein [Patescibacteria group bacterium]|nr:four helix bundle protein [Patescibacteria group bacterium]